MEELVIEYRSAKVFQPGKPKTIQKICFVELLSRYFFCLLFMSVAAKPLAARTCFSYNTVKVNLSGEVKKKVFPGPPNYQDIGSGDTLEEVWLLKLREPICTQASRKDELSEAENGVYSIQMVLVKSQYRKYKKLIKKPIIATGTLFHGYTGHHHTKVLIKVENIFLEK
ncbi:DUF4431 domain-containing protein [Anthocerotibacter panamensis]|uniref:DUF4431 domain-containing protein n=1 Tax=Anthocerotibacter panamensis TaxID=2857077 RepID=UPI001C404E7A|nr:DUF4431 domain-containing protein [Anthocerotibacter panamensis]